MQSCEAIPEAVPGLIPSGHPDVRRVSGVCRAVLPAGGASKSPPRRAQRSSLSHAPERSDSRRGGRDGFALLGAASTGPATDTDERRRAGLPDTRNAQPALGIAGFPIPDAPSRTGVRLHVVAGRCCGDGDRTVQRPLHGIGAR